MEYEKRVVAYIDILGFKNILNNTVNKGGKDNIDSINELIKVYNQIRDIWDLDENRNSSNKERIESKEVTIFSDTIVISFKVTDTSEVFFTLLELKWLVMELVWNEILCRGAISIGKLIHTDKYLFGPALVEAYTLEKKAALYPRIILDRKIIDLGAKYRSEQHTKEMERSYVEELLEKDSDGMYYIDYFTKAQHELNDPDYDFPAYIDRLGDIIRKGLRSFTHPSNADIRVKYTWMRERYNALVDEARKKEFINLLKKHGEIELIEYYSKLKKISTRR